LRIDVGDHRIPRRDQFEQPVPKGLIGTHVKLVERNALLQQLKSVGSSSYAVDMGEYLEDVRSVASPVRDYARAVVGVLAVAAPSSRLSVERIDKEVAPAVVKAALELSSRLGFDGAGVRREARA